MGKPKLYHYSSDPIVGVGDVQQATAGSTRFSGFYPRGLWFAPERTWPEWADFRDKESFAHRYRVEVVSGANVVTLSTPEQAAVFSEEFGAGRCSRGSVTRIKWDLVAKKYDGILLAFHPRGKAIYDHKANLWLMSWDIECGCVWNHAAVSVFDRLRKVLPHDPEFKHWMTIEEEKPKKEFQPVEYGQAIFTPADGGPPIDLGKITITGWTASTEWMPK